MEAAMSGPKLRDIELYGQSWDIEQAEVISSENEVLITGRVVRRKNLDIGDKVDYTFKFVSGEMVQSDISIKEQSWLPIASKVLDVVAKYRFADSWN